MVQSDISVRSAHWRAAGHEHPQHVIAALARLAEAGEPMPGAGQQLRRVRTRAEPGDEEKGRGVVCAERGPAADLLRGHLDRIQRRSRYEVEAGTWATQCLRISHHVTERRRRADPSQGNAGDPVD